MSQFDVHRNMGRHRATIPFVVVVQSSLYAKARRRVVVPLVATAEIGKVASLPASPVNPVFEVEGAEVVLNPFEIVSIPIETLGEKVATLAEEGDKIIAALDELFSRAWN